MAVVLALLLTVTAVGLALPGAEAATSGSNPPKGVHLSYMNDPTTATLTWHTTASSTSRAEWGLSSGTPYAYSATGTDYTSPGGAFLHVVTLTGLTPGATYYYRVGDASMSSWFGEGRFRAAPPLGDAGTFTFGAAGDWGDTATTVATSNSLASKNPNLALLLGDLYYSNDEAIIKKVYEAWQPFGQGTFTQTDMGNHEYANGNDNRYTPTNVHCAYVNMPGNERSFSFTYGNTFFLTLDWGASGSSTSDGVDGTGGSCGGASGTSAIRAWADAQLAAANNDANVKWKIVSEHFICYEPGTGDHNNATICPNGFGRPDQIEDIFVNRAVDVVLQAHDHTYGRTHPVKFGTVMQTGSVYDRPGAPLYVLLGTGGSPGTSGCRSEPWIAVCRAPIRTEGFGHFAISPSKIEYQFLENAAGVVDGFTLYKSPDFSVSVSPNSTKMTRGDTALSTVSVTGSPAVGTVTLTATGCPADTNCSLSPDSGIPPYSSTLTISTGSDAPLGTWPVTITGTNASVSRTAPFSLQIALQATRTFRRGDGGLYSETDDTYLYNGAPTQNYGTGVKLLVDGSGCIATGTICRTLLKFPDFVGPNPGQVPAGANVVDASLDLWITNTGLTQDAHQVTEAWTETGATWNSFAAPGWPANKGRAFTFAPTSLGLLRLNVTSIVANWAKGEANQGILFTSTHYNGVDYDSSEGANRPVLRVTYEPTGSQPFDFSVSVSPASGSVRPGESAATTVTVALLSGSPRTVSLRCEDLPAGGACAFSPSSGSPTFTSSLVLQTSPSTPTGTYPVRVIGKNGTDERTATYTLTVANTYTLTFRKGDGGLYSETDDSHMYSGAPNSNYGGAILLLVDASGCIASGTVCRSLLMFPIFIGPNSGQVPANAQIVSATLEIVITDSGGTQQAYQIDETWAESTVTWNTFATPGSPTTKGSPVSFAAPKGTITINITAFVQNWANGDSNLGIFITSSSSNGVDYRSSESTVTPKLTVTYRVV